MKEKNAFLKGSQDGINAKIIGVNFVEINSKYEICYKVDCLDYIAYIPICKVQNNEYEIVPTIV